MTPSSSPGSIPQDLSAPLLPSIFQEIVESSTLPMLYDAVLKSTKVQIPDAPTVPQTTSSHLVASPLQVDYAMNARDKDIQIIAQLHHLRLNFSLPP